MLKQSIKIKNLEKELQQEKESNSNLRIEVIERNLENRKLKQFKDKIILIMNGKGTIVDKYDKIRKELDYGDQSKKLVQNT